MAMRILVLGATGFIGQATVLRLKADGHVVTGLGRTVAPAQRRYPDVTWIKRDMARLTTPEDWLTDLSGIDVVVNCAGALQDGLRDDVAAVQWHAMTALYQAARCLPVLPLIVQISAPRDLSTAGTCFIETKLSADKALSMSGLPHVILRPTLVIGRNAYGGSALLRGLAALPGRVALSDACSTITAVHMDDVTDAVAQAASGRISAGSDLVLAGATPRSLEETVLLHRRWLGLKPAKVVHMPRGCALFLARLADIAGRLGWRSPLRSTAMAISGIGISAGGGPASNVAQRVSADPFARLMQTPAGAQDLWFARLYLLKPSVIVILAAFWVLSGLVPLRDVRATAALFGGTLPASVAWATTVATSLLDLALGLAVLVQPFARRAMIAMLIVSCAYLGFATMLQPFLWLDPLGPLVKVLPSMVLTLIGLAVMEER